MHVHAERVENLSLGLAEDRRSRRSRFIRAGDRSLDELACGELGEMTDIYVLSVSYPSSPAACREMHTWLNTRDSLDVLVNSLR